MRKPESDVFPFRHVVQISPTYFTDIQSSGGFRSMKKNHSQRIPTHGCLASIAPGSSTSSSRSKSKTNTKCHEHQSLFLACWFHMFRCLKLFTQPLTAMNHSLTYIYIYRYIDSILIYSIYIYSAAMDSSLAAPPRPRVQSLWVRLAEIPTCSFQHSHLASEWISFGESLDHVECKICFCFNKMINGKMAPSKARHHQVIARSPTQNPKATHLRPSAQHTLAVLGHGRPCSQKHFT